MESYNYYITPSDIQEIEMKVIGAIIQDSDHYFNNILILKKELFNFKENSLLFEYIETEYQLSKSIDIVILIRKIVDTTQNWNLYVINCIEKYSPTLPIVNYIKILFENNLRRESFDLFQKTLFELPDRNIDIQDINDKFENNYQQIINQLHNTKRVPSWKDNIKESIKQAEIRKQKYESGQKTSIATNTNLDNILRINKGDFMILAGRPSMGKTSFALFLTRQFVKQDIAVVLFSLEMTAIKLTDRILCAESDCDYERYVSGRINTIDLERIERNTNRVLNFKLQIDDNATLTINYLKSKLRQLHRQNKVDICIIDYLGLIQAGSRYSGNRNNEVSEISAGLKSIAHELDIPVIALSQLNRANETEKGNKPGLHNLRDSGSLEQDADTVIFVYRPAYYDKEIEKTAENMIIELIIAKQRDGATGNVVIYHNYTMNNFYNNVPDNDIPVNEDFENLPF